MNTRSITFIGLAALLLAGCSTTGGERGPWGKGRSSERVEEKEPVLPTPAWWYARREYDPNFMTWGKIRHPQAAPKWEKWVLIDEDRCKAPHRKLGSEGADNHREYKFYGHFADRKGYEPASDEFCQVFVLERWEPLGSAAAPAANASATSAPASAPTDEPPPAPPE